MVLPAHGLLSIAIYGRPFSSKHANEPRDSPRAHLTDLMALGAEVEVAGVVDGLVCKTLRSEAFFCVLGPMPLGNERGFSATVFVLLSLGLSEAVERQDVALPAHPLLHFS